MTKCPKCGVNLEVRLTAAPPMQSEQAGNSREMSLSQLLDVIDDGMIDNDGVAKFVRETRERFEKYGDGTRISDKQLAWLRRIADEQQ